MYKTVFSGILIISVLIIFSLYFFKDTDADGIIDRLDGCPDAKDPFQIDNDWDKIGDACDLDDDNDGILDHMEK